MRKISWNFIVCGRKSEEGKLKFDVSSCSLIHRLGFTEESSTQSPDFSSLYRDNSGTLHDGDYDEDVSWRVVFQKRLRPGHSEVQQ